MSLVLCQQASIDASGYIFSDVPLVIRCFPTDKFNDHRKCLNPARETSFNISHALSSSLVNIFNRTLLTSPFHVRN